MQRNHRSKGEPAPANIKAQVDWTRYPETSEQVGDLVEQALAPGKLILLQDPQPSKAETLANLILFTYREGTPARFAKMSARLTHLATTRPARSAGNIIGPVSLVAAGAIGMTGYKGRQSA